MHQERHCHHALLPSTHPSTPSFPTFPSIFWFHFRCDWFILGSANCRYCGVNEFFCLSLPPLPRSNISSSPSLDQTFLPPTLPRSNISSSPPSIKHFLPPPPSIKHFFLPSLDQTFSSSHPPSLCVCKFYNLKKTVCERVLFHPISLMMSTLFFFFFSLSFSSGPNLNS